MSFENIGDSWDRFKTQTIDYISTFSIKQLFVLLSIFSFCFLLFFTLQNTILILKKKASANLKYFYILFSTIAIPVITFAPIFGGNYAGWDCIRYNIFGGFLSIFNLVLPFYNKKPFPFISSIISGCFIIGICSILIVGSRNQNPIHGLKTFFTYYPEEAKELDSLSKSLNIQYGICVDYWKAKRITMFSKQNVRMYAANADGTPYSHVTNEYWYLGKKTGKYSHPDFRFLYWRTTDSLPKIIGQDTVKISRIIPLQDKEYSLFVIDSFSYKNIKYKLH